MINKEYRKMQKSFTKKLVKQAKEFRPYDWQYLFDMIKLMVDNFYQYYLDGNNVWQTDDSRQKIITELQEVEDLLAQFDDDKFNDDAFKFSDQHCIENHYNGIYGCSWDNEENYNTYLQMLKQADKQRLDVLKQSFSKMAEYLQDWWD